MTQRQRRSYPPLESTLYCKRCAYVRKVESKKECALLYCTFFFSRFCGFEKLKIYLSFSIEKLLKNGYNTFEKLSRGD